MTITKIKAIIKIKMSLHLLAKMIAKVKKLHAGQGSQSSPSHKKNPELEAPWDVI